MSARPHRSRRLRALSALAGVLAACAIAAAPARAAEVIVEAEALTPLGAGGWPQPDQHASAGNALQIAPGGAAEGTVTAPQSTTHLFLRARGNECFGPPTVSLRINGVERLAGPVSTGAYGELGVGMSIPAGVHQVSVAVTNGPSPLCDRSAWIDTLTVVGQPFSPVGWRNARLSKRAPIAKNSRVLVNELRSQIKSRPRGAVVGSGHASSPIYTVPRDQPTVRVHAPPGSRIDRQGQWAAVPLPPNARPASGSDARLVVWQPSTDTMWEFWGLSRDPLGRWFARFGGRLPNVSRTPGHFVDPPGTGFGASATSIAIMAGTQRIEELRRGVIDHAVDMAVLESGGRDGWCWPAQRTDRHLASRAADAIPGGTRFRLPANFNLAAYAREHPMSRYALTVARAVQRYGAVARETSVDVRFYAEDPTPLGWDPYPEIFEGRSADSRGALKNFPWRKLQVVAPPPGTGCTDDPDRD